MDEQNIGGVSNNNPQSMQDSYSLLDGRIGLRSASGDWDLTVFGYNLGDEEYCIQKYDQPLGSFLGALDAANNTMVQRCVVDAPRTWNARFAYRF
jgi:iron complex outermembrane recepter protein